MYEKYTSPPTPYLFWKFSFFCRLIIRQFFCSCLFVSGHVSRGNFWFPGDGKMIVFLGWKLSRVITEALKLEVRHALYSIFHFQPVFFHPVSPDVHTRPVWLNRSCGWNERNHGWSLRAARFRWLMMVLLTVDFLFHFNMNSSQSTFSSWICVFNWVKDYIHTVLSLT